MHVFPKFSDRWLMGPKRQAELTVYRELEASDAVAVALFAFSTFAKIEPGPPASQGLAGGPGSGIPGVVATSIPSQGGDIHVARHP